MSAVENGTICDILVFVVLCGPGCGAPSPPLPAHGQGEPGVVDGIGSSPQAKIDLHEPVSQRIPYSRRCLCGKSDSVGAPFLGISVMRIEDLYMYIH